MSGLDAIDRAVADIAEGKPRSRLSDFLNLPPQPFAVPVPTYARKLDGRPLRAMVFGDTHKPFHDPMAEEVALAIAKDYQPDVLLHTGDLVDCWQISRFDKDPTRLDTLQDNIDQARTFLHQIAQAVPKARRVLLEGNHEARLTKTLWKLDGGARELPRLRIVREALTWPALLGLADIGWEFIGEHDQSKTEVLPKLVTVHGNIVRKWSAYTARGQWERYGRSGISGHTHRAGVFAHRDHNGQAVWIEAGCTCLLDPPYMTDPDWCQAVVLLEWTKDRRVMSERVVRIRDGVALVDGTTYKAKGA